MALKVHPTWEHSVPEPLLALLRGARLRERVRRGAKALMEGAAVALAWGGLVIVAWRMGLVGPDLAMGAAGGLALLPLVAALAAMMRPLPLFDMACRTDRRLGLDDRLASAVEVLTLPYRPLGALMVADAARVAQNISPARALPLGPPPRLTMVALLLAMDGLFLWPGLPPSPRPPGPMVPSPSMALPQAPPPSDREVAVAQEELLQREEEARREGKREMAEGLREMAEATRGRRQEALARLERLRDTWASQAWVDQEGLQRSLKALAGPLLKGKATRPIGEALKEGDLEQARRQLERLRRDQPEGEGEQEDQGEGQEEQSQGEEGAPVGDSQVQRALERLQRELGDGENQRMAKAAQALGELQKALERVAQAGELDRQAGEVSKALQGSKEARFQAKAAGKEGSAKEGQGPGEPGQKRPGGQGDGELKEAERMAMVRRPRLGGLKPGQGHSAQLQGQATDMEAKAKDSPVSQKGGQGPSRKEVIRLSSTQGFASVPYRQVFQDYSAITEEVMREEEVPLGMRDLVRTYFWAIRPRP